MEEGEGNIWLGKYAIRLIKREYHASKFLIQPFINGWIHSSFFCWCTLSGESSHTIPLICQLSSCECGVATDPRKSASCTPVGQRIVSYDKADWIVHAWWYYKGFGDIHDVTCCLPAKKWTKSLTLCLYAGMFSCIVSVCYANASQSPQASQVQNLPSIPKKPPSWARTPSLNTECNAVICNKSVTFWGGGLIHQREIILCDSVYPIGRRQKYILMSVGYGITVYAYVVFLSTISRWCRKQYGMRSCELKRRTISWSWIPQPLLLRLNVCKTWMTRWCHVRWMYNSASFHM